LSKSNNHEPAGALLLALFSIAISGIELGRLV
jgi:hypothetical protein